MKLNKSTKFEYYKGLIIPPAIRDFLAGRIWIKDHLSFPKPLIEALIKHGIIQTIDGVSENRCNRCGNTKRACLTKFQCAKCEKICTYCRHCIQMGRIASCTKLVIWAAKSPRYNESHTFEWQGQFTPLQQLAANELLESVKQRRSHLTHAVCGAGKTEILFQAVHYCLNKGLRVCIATPRTDVVLELSPRFQQVFPKTRIHVLYGGAPNQQGHAQLVIATTHQLYRFQDAFDIMIVDEADAFPYTFDEALQKAVIKAKKESAPILFVTATPSLKLLARKNKERWGYSFIPKRYHDYPLPVPKLEALWRYGPKIEKGKIPHKLKKWTEERIGKNEPFLIFFPTIEMLAKAVPLFQEIHPDIQGVYSEDANRKEKVLSLRNEAVPGLLTTTILERGITIKNVQVAVVGAEAAIFNASALIQISGRVGRNVQYPDGEIIFFHHGITSEMDAAIGEIKRLNQEGFPQ